MKNIKFISSWENKQKRGLILYLFSWATILPICCLIGKILGEYIGFGILFKSFSIFDYIAIIVICVLGILLGTNFWIRNEKRYKKLKNINTKK